MYSWWKYDNVIDDETISKIMESTNQEWSKASIKGKETYNEKIRKTDIIWNNEQWLYDLFWGYMINANKQAGWNLDIDCAESFQLGRYKDGGHYDYHTDNEGFNIIDDKENKLLHGKTRKISMVLWLNENFKGGEFEFFKEKIKPTKGTLMFFPSWILHKVNPVTEGIRYSLVTWFCGKPLR